MKGKIFRMEGIFFHVPRSLMRLILLFSFFFVSWGGPLPVSIIGGALNGECDPSEIVYLHHFSILEKYNHCYPEPIYTFFSIHYRIDFPIPLMRNVRLSIPMLLSLPLAICFGSIISILANQVLHPIIKPT